MLINLSGKATAKQLTVSIHHRNMSKNVKKFQVISSKTLENHTHNMCKKDEQQNQMRSTPPSILRVSGRPSHMGSRPSITLNAPTDAATNTAQREHQHFEEHRREHYHNEHNVKRSSKSSSNKSTSTAVDSARTSVGSGSENESVSKESGKEQRSQQTQRKYPKD